MNAPRTRAAQPELPFTGGRAVEAGPDMCADAPRRAPQVSTAKSPPNWMPSPAELAEAAAIPKGSAIAEARRLIELGVRLRPRADR